MFLDVLEKRNPNLIKTAFQFHQQGLIRPDTYILDLDAILYNGKLMLDEAEKHGVKLYAMTKQFGRNPIIAKELVKLGYKGIVAVDYKETEIMIDNQIKLGNVGHLVQIPKAMIKKVVEANPEIITVYSLEKVFEIDKAAGELGKVQDIMVRVLEESSEIYSGQKGGFYISELPEIIKTLKAFKNIKIVGVTSFPCFLYVKEANKILPTPNIETVKKAVDIFKNNGIDITQINTPSGTSVENMARIKECGGTHGEPGHSLTGTTQYNARNLDGELPGIIYVSEVSHNLAENSFCYGGGHYRRSGIANALVGKSYESCEKYGIEAPTMESIDYCFELSKNATVGDTVVSCFRTQIFVTRSDVAVVSGISTGKPELLGIFDSLGRKIG